MTDDAWNTEPGRPADHDASTDPTTRFDRTPVDSTEQMPAGLHPTDPYPQPADPHPVTAWPGAGPPPPIPPPSRFDNPPSRFDNPLPPAAPDPQRGSFPGQQAGSFPVQHSSSVAAPVNPMSAPSAPAQPLPPSVESTGWSPLGSAPSGPPVRSGSQGGQPRYLPPVAPPTTVEIAAEAAPRRAGARWGWRAFVSFVAGGLIAAVGFGAAQLGQTDQTTALGPTTVSTTATTVAVPSLDTGTVPLTPLEVDEPAAFVAQSLGPAVVQIESQLGLGSGVIFGDGLILTNNHVISGATVLRVKLSTGRILPAEVVGSDLNTDVAVVSVGPGLDLPIARLATGHKAQVGQIAIAIGSPFDLQQSVTAGIVSAVDRPIQNTDQSVVAMIQTDAPINPGNSGGALADRQGRVIGINTSIQTDGLTNTNVGVGFAIPVDTAVRIADLLVAGEPIQPGFLGVRGDEPPGGEVGVRLIEVTAGSAAESAGLVVGDRVLSLNGAPVTEFPELAGLVLANQAGDTVKLEVMRDGELVELDVTLGLKEGN